MVTVERVKNIRPYSGFDHIDLAEVKGKDVVVGKGEFKEKDLCVFFEAGTLIPINSVKSHYLEKFKVTINKKQNYQAYRVKPLKVKTSDGIFISQGIAFTLQQFYRMIRRAGINTMLSSKEAVIPRRSYRAQEHDDLTDVVGAFQYNPKGRYLTTNFTAPLFNRIPNRKLVLVDIE